MNATLPNNFSAAECMELVKQNIKYKAPSASHNSGLFPTRISNQNSFTPLDTHYHPSCNSIMTSVPLSFGGAVNIAVRKVKEDYSEAQLYEALATTPNDQYVDSPQKFSHLRVVFNDGDSGGTVIIESTVWGEFAPLQHIDSPYLDDVVIPWPVQMDAPEADQILKNAGYTQPYNSMILRHPLYPGLEEPYYIFHLEKEGFIFVGIESHKVFPADQETLTKVERSLKQLRALGK